MGGKRSSNLASTTLPRTETTFPRFDKLALLSTFSFIYPTFVGIDTRAFSASGAFFASAFFAVPTMLRDAAPGKTWRQMQSMLPPHGSDARANLTGRAVGWERHAGTVAWLAIDKDLDTTSADPIRIVHSN